MTRLPTLQQQHTCGSYSIAPNRSDNPDGAVEGTWLGPLLINNVGDGVWPIATNGGADKRAVAVGKGDGTIKADSVTEANGRGNDYGLWCAD